MDFSILSILGVIAAGLIGYRAGRMRVPTAEKGPGTPRVIIGARSKNKRRNGATAIPKKSAETSDTRGAHTVVISPSKKRAEKYLERDLGEHML